MDFEEIKSQNLEHFEKVSKEFAQNFPENNVHLIIVGGDGTMHLALNYIIPNLKES